MFSPRVVRVTYGLNDTLPELTSFSVIARPGKVRWRLSENPHVLSLNAGELVACVSRADGEVVFRDKSGYHLLAENMDGRRLSPVDSGNGKAMRSRQEFFLQADEAIFGLGNLAELEDAKAVYPPIYPNVYPRGEGRWYDPFSAEGRRIYWKQISKNLFSRGFDGWWLDASEAELGGKWGRMREIATAGGPGAGVFNTYPLLHTTGIYQGQRVESSDKRVFILTRSACPGQQRNSAVTWSGDTEGKREIFRNQIPAGLNFTVTGIPKEIWRFGEATQKIMADYIHLRCRLLPYIYSVSWMVTDNDYTMMRPPVMDFRRDRQVHGIADQFMFGPALMANPVVKPGADSRDVYLPFGANWIDFWTGESYTEGRSIPWNCASTAVRTALSLCTRTRATATSTKRAHTPLSNSIGMNGNNS